MIYHYKHKSIRDLSHQELDLLGYEGIYQYAQEHNMNPASLFETIKQLESDIFQMGNQPFDMTKGKNLDLMNKWVDKYITYFNNHASYEKQAYVILGNIASGKSTYARQIEKDVNAIIIDADRFKMGEETTHGFFEGFTSLYNVETDRERLQDPCSDATKKVLTNASNLGMNLILPKASSSIEKLEKQLEVLMKNNYDIHLILFESPIEDCANRNYFRYLVKQYAPDKESFGRFVPISILTNIGDGTFNTFAKAYKQQRYKSFKGFFNKGSFGSDTAKFTNEEIDLPSMQI